VALAAHPAGVAQRGGGAGGCRAEVLCRTRCTRPARLGRRLEHASRRDAWVERRLRSALLGGDRSRMARRPRRRTPAFGRRHGVHGEELGPRLCGAPVVGPHRRLRQTARATWIAREGGPTSRRDGPTRDIPPTPGHGRGIRLRGDRGCRSPRKRRRRRVRGRRPAPRRLDGRHSLRRAPGSTQGRRDPTSDP
jgi:hypothetical protein